MKQRQRRQLIGAPLLAIGSLLWLWAGLLAGPARVAANGGSLGPAIDLVQVTAGLSLPVHLTPAGDSSGRLFVVEQRGRIRILKDGLLQGEFLDISGRVRCCGEEGLLSVAFPPGYASNNHFYVYYTNSAGNNVVARFGLLNANQADPTSEQIVLTIDHPGQTNHNGGQLAFSPIDGYLYLAPGDGGGGGDPNNNAQNPASLLGKILRLDVESGSPATYTIPASNPFTQTAGHRAEIWALGLRNPWRFAFDRQNGDLFIGDVGQNAYEEIDYQPAASRGGENYGWRILEGDHCFNPASGCTPPANYAPPVAEYDHSLGCSVTGGQVYRGPIYYRLQGLYLYGDFCSGRIWGLKQSSSGWQNSLLLDTAYNLSSFGEDEAGNLYVIHRGDNGAGAIYQIRDTSPPDLALSRKTVSPATGEAGEVFTVTINLINSGLPFAETIRVTDTVPAGLAYVPGTLTATSGLVNDSGQPLRWQGLLSDTTQVQISYQVTATGAVTGGLGSAAIIDGGSLGVYPRTATVTISPAAVYYFPVIFKS